MINNLHTPDECWDFILNKVKPSYNNWQGKEEYEDRFFYIVSKRFWIMGKLYLIPTPIGNPTGYYTSRATSTSRSRSNLG